MRFKKYIVEHISWENDTVCETKYTDNCEHKMISKEQQCAKLCKQNELHL